MHIHPPFWKVAGIRRLSALALALGIVAPSTAQQFELVGGAVGAAAIDTRAAVTRNVNNPDPCDPRVPGPIMRDRQWNGNNFTPSAFLQNIPNLADPNKPWELFYHYNLLAEVDGGHRVSGRGSICDCFILEKKSHTARAQSMMFMGAYGDLSNELFMQWRNLSQTSTRNTDQSGSASGESNSNLSISFRITGLPDDTPVTVHYRYNTTAIGWTSHEGNGEDPIRLRLQDLSLAGSNLIPGGTNPNGHALYDQDGQIDLLAGHVYTLSFNAKTDASVTAPSLKLNGTCLEHYEDSSFAQFMGKIVLGFSSISQSLQGSPSQAQACDHELAFSLATGSAREASLGGPFDPGDLYPRGYFAGLYPGYFRDDLNLFGGVDPFPLPGDPASAAPVDSGLAIASVQDLYFDLNAAALLPFDLTQFSYGPGQPALTRSAIEAATGSSHCIHPPRYVLISQRDSGLAAYTSSFPTGAPSNSATSGSPFGKTVPRKEVQQYELPGYSGSPALGPDPQFDETTLEPLLGLNPDAGLMENDDVNALASFSGDPLYAQCSDFTYISASHQARYGLIPGILYVTPSAGGALTPAITPDDLGIAWSADLDAADFTWWIDPSTGLPSLALLFSVSEDLPETPEDESAGLDPKRVYFSFLDGLHSPTAIIAGTDIDALAVVPCRLFSPVAISTSTLPDAEVCSAYSATLLATGGFAQACTWSITSGSLPPGLKLDASTGEISGIPLNTGNYSFDLACTGPVGSFFTVGLSITVDPPPGPPVVSTSLLPAATPGVPYAEFVTANGGCKPVYLTASNGALPPGLLLDPVSGLISGTPLASGLFPFEITATDASGLAASAPLSIDVQGSAPPVIRLNTRIFGPFNLGDTVSMTLDAIGGTPPYQYFINSPPAGFSLVGDTLTGTASSPPVAYGVEVQITDSQFQTGVDTLFFTVPDTAPGDPVLLDPGPQDWIAGKAVDLLPTVSGGTPPLTFSLVHGQPPAGMGISPASGRVYGVPVFAGDGVLGLLVEDALGRQDAVLIPYEIHTWFIGGYPAWKLFYGVGSDDEDLEMDQFPAIAEYYMGLNPTVSDPPSLFHLRDLGNGLFRMEFPSVGIQDVSIHYQRLDPGSLLWNPAFSNPFPVFSKPEIHRVDFTSP